MHQLPPYRQACTNYDLTGSVYKLPPYQQGCTNYHLTGSVYKLPPYQQGCTNYHLPGKTVINYQYHLKALLHGKASIAILVSCNFLYHDPCQFITKSSSMFHAEFIYKMFSPKWRILTMKTLSYKLRRLSICSFDQITSLLFSPFQPCFIYHVLTMCFYLLTML
jgi:hypothetical protein